MDISKEEFDKIQFYFKENIFWRLGVNHYPKYHLFVHILYDCGLRIGEASALTYEEFETFDYYRKDEKKPVRIAPTSESTKGTHLQGMRVKVTKAVYEDKRRTFDEWRKYER